MNDRRRPVTARAVAIGLLCAAGLCALTPYNDYKVAATYLAGNQFPIGAIFVLFLLVLLNAPLHALRPKAAFSQGELLTVWTLILVASGIPSSGMMRYLIPHIVAPAYYSTEVNHWEYRVWGGGPDWLKFTDRAAATAFFEGYPRGQEHVPWDAWAGPLLGWFAFGALFLVASFCLANVLRRQWADNERFSFPLVALPVLLSEEPEPGRRVNALLRSPPFWVALALTTALHTVNGLHQLYPALPEIPTRLNLLDYLRTSPWDQVGQFNAHFYPIATGLAFLLPTEVSFSLWFFHLFYKFEILLCAVYNWEHPGPLGGAGQKQFHSLQCFGGAVGVALWVLWTARRHLRDVWEKATGGPGAASIDDSGEMFSYRAALIGLGAAYAGMALWLYLAGVPALLLAATLLVMTLVLLSVSYLVTQAGTLYMSPSYGSLDALGATFGTRQCDAHAWYATYRLEWMFYRDTRELLLPELLNGAKAAERGGTALRSLFRAVVAAVLLAIVVGGVASLSLPYYNGGANLMPNGWTYRSGPTRPLQLLGGAAVAPLPAVPSNLLHVLGGFAGVLGLLAARAYLGWGVHPIGFLAASSSAGHFLWVSLLLGWLAKALVMRYGGMRGYRSALPFFLGLMLGDALNAVLWIVLGYLTGTGYALTPP